MAKKAIQNKQEGDEEQISHAPKSLMERLGIPMAKTNREPQIYVYKLSRIERGKLDRLKFPDSREEMVENSQIFACWEDAHKQCIKLEKEYKGWLYSPQSCFLPKSEVPEKILNRIEKIEAEIAARPTHFKILEVGKWGGESSPSETPKKKSKK